MGMLFSSFFGMSDPIMSIDLNFTKDINTQQDNTELENKITDLLLRTNNALCKLKSYNGCGKVIQQALRDYQNVEVQKSSFETISSSIQDIGSFYSLSTEIVQAMNDLLSLFADDYHQYEQYPHVARMMGELLVFCLEFDQNKMMKPELQNDFSFYRRCLTSTHLEALEKPVPPDLAPEISMWIADSQPMFGALTPKNGNMHSVPIAVEKAPAVAYLASICCGMIQRQRCGDNLSFIMKVMVASTILYDRISLKGTFHPDSVIKIMKVVQAISKHGGEDKTMLQCSIKYSTTHYKDPSTPSRVKNALDT